MKTKPLILKYLKTFYTLIKKNNNQDGWTFVETLIVIAIVLILTSTVGFMAFKYIDKAKIVTAKSQLENLSLALNTYYMDCKRYPTEDQGLNSLWEKPNLEPIPEDWNGPYLNKPIPSDPWGNPYQYIIPGPSGLPFGIQTLGSDGTEGGEENDKDINTWE